MFEQGNKLKQDFGDENVYDFSIGNPEVEPPEEVVNAINEIAADKTTGNTSIYAKCRLSHLLRSDSEKLTAIYGMEVPSDNICMVCGAAAGLKCGFKVNFES